MKSAKRFKDIILNADCWATAFVIAMIVPNVLLDITENFNTAGKIANIIVPASIYLLLVSKFRRTGAVILWLLIMIVMNAFQIVLFYLYGESIIAIDMLLNCVTSNPEEAGELLSNLTLPIVINIVIYVPFIIWAIYASLHRPSLRSSDRFRRRGFRVGFFSLIAGIVAASVALLLPGKYAVDRNLYPFNVISNIGSAIGRLNQSVRYHTTSRDFSYNAHLSSDADSTEVIVLIIGETSRAGNWQLFGYDRPTNPRLSQRNDLILFPKAISQSNTTHKCVPLMLTPVAPQQFDSIMYYKSIVTAFKEAGYATSFYSNQSKNHSYTQFFSEEADNCQYLKGNQRFDHLMIDSLARDLEKSPGRKFIVLHTYGSHFNYHDRYTSDFSHFTPDGSTNANQKHRPILVNAYDNSIRYIDNYLADALDIIQQSGVNAAVVFSADHGEDIFDDQRERFLHASPVATYWQLHVPMWIWLSPGFKQTHPQINEALHTNATKYVAPSQSVFHTLIELSDITTPYYDETQSVASTKYTTPQPVYLDDYNDAVPLEESGLKANDIDRLKSIGIPIQ